MLESGRSARVSRLPTENWTERMLLVHHFLEHIEAAPGVAFQPHLKLSFNGILLPIHVLGVKAR